MVDAMNLVRLYLKEFRIYEAPSYFTVYKQSVGLPLWNKLYVLQGRLIKVGMKIKVSTNPTRITLHQVSQYDWWRYRSGETCFTGEME